MGMKAFFQAARLSGADAAAYKKCNNQLLKPLPEKLAQCNIKTLQHLYQRSQP